MLQNEELTNEFQTPNFVTSAKGDCLSLLSSLSIIMAIGEC